MDKARRIRWAKDKRDLGGFVALSYMVLRSEEFAALSGIAVKLFLDLLAQYRGNNNGDFTLAWSVMAKRGWRSRDTLGRARQELLDRRFIALTAQGGRHRPSLYGVTIFALDQSAKLDISSREFPRGNWKARAKIGDFSVPPVVRIGTDIDTPVVSIERASGAASTPIVSVAGGRSDELTRRSCTSIELPSLLSKTNGSARV